MSLVRNNKGIEGWMTTMILGMLLLGFLVIPISLYSTDILTTYTNETAHNLSYISKTREITEMIQEAKDPLEESPIGSEEGTLWFLGRGSISAIKVLMKSFQIFPNLIADMARNMGIAPIWFISLLTIIPVAVLLLAILAWLMKRWG